VIQGGLFGPAETATRWRPAAPPSLQGIDEIALDYETTGLNWRKGARPIGAALAYRKPGQTKITTQYLPWGHASGNLDEARVKEWHKQELRGKKIKGQNIKFDAHMAYAWGVDLEAQGNRLSDVGHSAALIDDHRRRFKLEELAQDHGLPGKKLGNLDITRMAEYAAGSVAEYAEHDARLVVLLDDIFQPEIVRQELQTVKDLEDEVIFPVLEMERNMVHLDEELLHKWIPEVRREYQRIIMEVKQESGFAFDPGSRADMQRLWNKLDLPVVKLTKGGAPSFDAEALAAVHHPLIDKLRFANKLENLLTMFFLPYAASVNDGLLPFNLHQLRSDEGGTITGRFSATDQNIQQVPAVKKQLEELGALFEWVVRRLFLPGWIKPGMRAKLLDADAKQIEYRIFAHYSEAPKILEAYDRDPETDYHDVVSKMIVGMVGLQLPRKAVKNINFAKIYGAQVKKLAGMLRLSVAETQRFVDAYDETFPETQELLNEAQRIASRRGYVKTILGRRGRFTTAEDMKRIYKALNTVIQGSAADVNKKKLVALHKERKATGFVMRMTVHDSVTGDAPDQKCVEMVKQVLDEQAIPLRVPILWDVKTGENWAKCA
jgi:DNA polymerase-1